MIVNCSVNAEHAKFAKTTLKRSAASSTSSSSSGGDMPTDTSLFVISDDNKTTATENDVAKSTTLFFNNNDDDDDGEDNGVSDNDQDETIKISDRIESSQRAAAAAAVDFVLLPEFLAANYGENRHENSKPNRSIQAPDLRQQHKRMADTQDLCDTSECKCKMETKFLTVDCNFQQVSNFSQCSFDFTFHHPSDYVRRFFVAGFARDTIGTGINVPCEIHVCVLHIVVHFSTIISMFD